jgi:hypothetical protein
MRILHLTAGNLFGGVEQMLLTLQRCGTHHGSFNQEFGLCFEGLVAANLRTLGASVFVLGPAQLRRPLSILMVRQGLRAEF